MALNRVRLYLRVIYISDITEYDGISLLAGMVKCKRSRDSVLSLLRMRLLQIAIADLSIARQNNVVINLFITPDRELNQKSSEFVLSTKYQCSEIS